MNGFDRMVDTAHSNLDRLHYRLLYHLSEIPLDMMVCRKAIQELVGPLDKTGKFEFNLNRPYSTEKTDYTRTRRKNEQLNDKLRLGSSFEWRHTTQPYSEYCLSTISKLNVNHQPWSKKEAEKSDNGDLNTHLRKQSSISYAYNSAIEASEKQSRITKSFMQNPMAAKVESILSEVSSTPAKHLVFSGAHELYEKLSYVRLKKMGNSRSMRDKHIEKTGVRPGIIHCASESAETRDTKGSGSDGIFRNKLRKDLSMPSYTMGQRHDIKNQLFAEPSMDSPKKKNERTSSNYQRSMKESSDTTKVKDEIRKYKELKKMELSSSQNQSFPEKKLDNVSTPVEKSTATIYLPDTESQIQRERPADRFVFEEYIKPKKLYQKKPVLKLLSLQKRTKKVNELVEKMNKIASLSPKNIYEKDKKPQSSGKKITQALKKTKSIMSQPMKHSVTDKLQMINRNIFRNPTSNLAKAFK